MDWYALWSECFIFFYWNCLLLFQFLLVTRFSCREFIFACFKHCFWFTFDFSFFTSIMLAIELKKMVNLVEIDLMSFIIFSFILRPCGCTLLIYLTSIILYSPPLCISYFCFREICFVVFFFTYFSWICNKIPVIFKSLI